MIKAVFIGIMLGLLMLVFIHPYVMGTNDAGLVITLSMMLAFGVAPLVFVRLPYAVALMVGCFSTIGFVHMVAVMGGH